MLDNESLAVPQERTAHRVWSEIDLDALARNFRRFRSTVPESIKMLVVVKADAYGHGAVPVAKTLVREGAEILGVGDSHEALELRLAGIDVPILILGAIIEGEIENVVSYDISPCIHSTARIEHLQDVAERQNKRVPVHLMVDTGMGRLGVSRGKVLELARRIHACSHLELDGICTHLSSVYGQSAEDRQYTRAQYDGFIEALNGLAGFLKCRPDGRPIWVHAANSGAMYGTEPPFNMVRPGNILYGLNPDSATQQRLGVEPILSLRSQVVFFKDVPKGTPVSYDRTFVTQRPTRIATIPVGYNDGFRAHLSNQAHVLLHGQAAPVIGKVTMDYTMVDVTDIPGVDLGDVATLVGRDGDREIRFTDLARTLDTTPLELVCGLGRRVRRVYSETRQPAGPAIESAPTANRPQRVTPFVEHASVEA